MPDRTAAQVAGCAGPLLTWTRRTRAVLLTAGAVSKHAADRRSDPGASGGDQCGEVANARSGHGVDHGIDHLLTQDIARPGAGTVPGTEIRNTVDHLYTPGSATRRHGLLHSVVDLRRRRCFILVAPGVSTLVAHRAEPFRPGW